MNVNYYFFIVSLVGFLLSFFPMRSFEMKSIDSCKIVDMMEKANPKICNGEACWMVECKCGYKTVYKIYDKIDYYTLNADQKVIHYNDFRIFYWIYYVFTIFCSIMMGVTLLLALGVLKQI